MSKYPEPPTPPPMREVGGPTRAGDIAFGAILVVMALILVACATCAIAAACA